MNKRILWLALAGLLLVATAGCSKRYTVEVQSDTCWSAVFDNQQTVDDCGNAKYDVIGTLTCVRVQKTTVIGTLRVRIDSGPWAETTDTLGIVQVCR